MLNLGKLSQLAKALSVDESVILGVLDDYDHNPDAIVKELTLWPSNLEKKPRDIISLKGDWRLVQQRLYRRLFCKKLKISPSSHGGVKGLSAATNARVHVGNSFLFTTDISSFYPSISIARVNKFFLSNNCSYHIARILTRLCTYDYHLALGLITSPIIANSIMLPIDERLQDLCKKMQLRYSRYVDDITISGNYDLEKSALLKNVSNIFTRYGFKLAKNKTRFGNIESGISVTGMRIKKKRIDVAREYVDDLMGVLEDHYNLSKGIMLKGPLCSEGELLGKCYYVCYTNPGRRRTLLGRLRKIDWSALMKHAVEMNLATVKPVFTKRGEKRPENTFKLQGVEVKERFMKKYKDYKDENPGEAPF